MLGLLRDDDPHATRRPGLADVPQLISQVRGAGLKVRFIETGTAYPLERGVELALYRVVQEALAERAQVARRCGGDCRAQARGGVGRAADRGRRRRRGPGGDGGRGLVGMRERVSVYGGTRTGHRLGRVRGARTAADQGGRRVIGVLIADDQELVRTGFRLILLREPASRWSARPPTGEEAVAAGPASRPDVVLMDIRMPGWTASPRPRSWSPIPAVRPGC